MDKLLEMSPAALGMMQGYVALVLLGLSLVALPRAYLRVFEVWRPATPLEKRLLGAAIAAAAVLRWFVAPLWIVTMFIGYHLTEQAIDLLPVSHYGVGSSAFYHALFAILPRDHRSLLWANSVVGVLTIPFYATYAARMTNDRRVGAIFAWLVALVPLFVKNDNSDANHVPLLWWLFGGLVLWDEALETGRRASLAAAMALFALATLARPEMPLLLPLLVAITTFARGWGEHRMLRTKVFEALALLFALAVLPQVLHVLRASLELKSRSSLNGLGLSRFLLAPALLLTNDTVLRPRLFPIALLPFALHPLLDRRPEGRRRPAALGMAAIVSLVVYMVDLCEANMARVQVPGALFVTMLAALGLSRAYDRVRAPAYRAAAAVLLVGTAMPSVSRLWAPTNEQAEEELIREAVARLPGDEPFTLVRMGWDDRDPEKTREFTHYYFPDYLIERPARKGRAISVAAWEQRPRFDVPAYFFAGVRCYASMRNEGTPPPPGDNQQRPCARMDEQFVLEPVFEREIPNRGDVWLEYYGDAPTLRVGLYRIRPRVGVASAR
nr:glycosyltransferase family 39 protein [Polyangium aurulentum]